MKGEARQSRQCHLSLRYFFVASFRFNGSLPTR
jgi:hypothetical protein